MSHARPESSDSNQATYISRQNSWWPRRVLSSSPSAMKSAPPQLRLLAELLREAGQCFFNGTNAVIAESTKDPTAESWGADHGAISFLHSLLAGS